MRQSRTEKPSANGRQEREHTQDQAAEDAAYEERRTKRCDDGAQNREELQDTSAEVLLEIDELLADALGAVAGIDTYALQFELAE